MDERCDAGLNLCPTLSGLQQALPDVEIRLDHHRRSPFRLAAPAGKRDFRLSDISAFGTFQARCITLGLPNKDLCMRG